MNRYIVNNLGKAKRSTSTNIFFRLLIFVFFIAYTTNTFSQIFEFRRIAAGADTSEIYISCYWFDDDTTKWGGVFRSVDNGKTLSVQYKDLWLGGIVYGEIFGDSLSGTVYLSGPLVSHDFGHTWEYKPTPITNYFEEAGGCLQGEIYIKGRIATGEKVLYRGTHFGDSLYLMNSAMDSLLCIEAGSLVGEVYAIQWPYYGPYSDTLGLAFSSDYGQTFTVSYIDTSIVSYLYQHTLAHGTDTGELYIAALDVYDRYHILRSTDYGQTFNVKYILPINWFTENFSFVAGRKPGSFYILKTYLAPFPPLHNCVEIHYSTDYGETYTVYYHELDSTYTGVFSPGSQEKGLICYPNPASDKITVTWIQHSTSSELQLYDLKGRLQLTIRIPTGQNKVLIDVSSLKSGIYLLMVKDGDRVIGVEKVVVQ